MYNEIILNRLKDLKFLTALKKSNVTITSKRNQFHDMVKFYAKIDKDKVIREITFKATGCTYFLVYCDIFCELVEGKSINDALKINTLKLEGFGKLDESRKHVIEIILTTFALLIKKYNRGLENGKIKPYDAEDVVIQEKPIDESKTKNKLVEKIVVNMAILEKKKSNVLAAKDITKIDQPNKIVDNKNNIETENNIDNKNININNQKVVNVDNKVSNLKKVDKKSTKKGKTRVVKSTEIKSEKTPVNTSVTKVNNNHVDKINHTNETRSKQNDMQSTSKQGVQHEKSKTSKQENVKHLSEMLGKLNHNTVSTNRKTSKSTKKDTTTTQNESSPKDDKFKLLLSKIIKK